MVPVWLNATLELQFYNLKELPIYKDGIPELPFYKEGHHFIKMFLINWLYPGSVSNYKFDVLVHFFCFLCPSWLLQTVFKTTLCLPRNP